MPAERKRLGEILRARGLVSEEQIQEALALCRTSGLRIGEALVRLGHVTETDVMQALAEQFDMEFVDLENLQLPPAVLELIPESVAKENIILPLGRDDSTMRIVVSDPLDLQTVDNLRFILNTDIECSLAPRTAIQAAIGRYYGAEETESVDSMLQEFTDTNIQFRDEGGEAGGEQGEDAPIVRLVHLMIADAVKQRASDIHVEPMGNRLRIRYRVDGVCQEQESPPKRLQSAILQRIKIMSGMKLDEKRLPQDGRIRFRAHGKDLDLRVSVLPGYHGEAVVMRILERQNVLVNIRVLGFSEQDYRRFEQIIRRPNGIFLVTGPTGSGKTTTLYISGINQCQVNERIGLTFAAILRSMLRQAPDVILVGEIRDSEAAEIAIQSALTGHLVFSTLHTNDAPAAVTRLIDMGVKPFLVASSVHAIMAQRLVRLTCDNCREEVTYPEAQLRSVGLTPERMEGVTLTRGRGCSECGHTGYFGRTGIFEMMEMDSELRELAFRRTPTNEFRRQCRLHGMRTLLEDGVEKVLQGKTTLEDVLRTCQAEVEQDV
ncbi:MAG: pilus assembly protein PilB [Planctomycetes bacterium DG_20]|nr:MAG: pilus assembly protein PilB [Planctomycetes bacterium DG_20]